MFAFTIQDPVAEKRFAEQNVGPVFGLQQQQQRQQLQQRLQQQQQQQQHRHQPAIAEDEDEDEDDEDNDNLQSLGRRFGGAGGAAAVRGVGSGNTGFDEGGVPTPQQQRSTTMGWRRKQPRTVSHHGGGGGEGNFDEDAFYNDEGLEVVGGKNRGGGNGGHGGGHGSGHGGGYEDGEEEEEAHFKPQGELFVKTENSFVLFNDAGKIAALTSNGGFA